MFWSRRRSTWNERRAANLSWSRLYNRGAVKHGSTGRDSSRRIYSQPSAGEVKSRVISASTVKMISGRHDRILRLQIATSSSEPETAISKIRFLVCKPLYQAHTVSGQLLND